MVCGQLLIKNSYNVRHFHPNCNLSAAYYVKAKEKCGRIKFFDPVDQKAMQSPAKKKILLYQQKQLILYLVRETY